MLFILTRCSRLLITEQQHLFATEPRNRRRHSQVFGPGFTTKTQKELGLHLREYMGVRSTTCRAYCTETGHGPGGSEPHAYRSTGESRRLAYSLPSQHGPLLLAPTSNDGVGADTAFCGCFELAVGAPSLVGPPAAPQGSMQPEPTTPTPKPEEEEEEEPVFRSHTMPVK